jgi:hypothetical protein
MNQKVPYLTRQIVYAFLVGLLVGGVSMAFFDAYAKKPLFSEAFMPGPNTFFCVNPDNPNETCLDTGGGQLPTLTPNTPSYREQYPTRPGVIRAPQE